MAFMLAGSASTNPVLAQVGAASAA